MAQPTMDADEAAFLTGLKKEIVAAINANTAAINAAVAVTAATAETTRLAVLQVKETTAATAEATRLAVIAASVKAEIIAKETGRIMGRW